MSSETKAKKSKRRKIALISLAVLLSMGGVWGWLEGRPLYYGIQAYIYGFPLVVMDMTRQVSTAVPTAGEFKAPMNQFSVMTRYPDASFRLIPRTGLDTQFATAWADLDAEPFVLSVPNTNGRYYVIALFDMWSNVFASIGSRTTGTDSANYLLAGPTWHGSAPEGMHVYKSPTRHVWVNGQMLSNGPADYEIVNALQNSYKLTPLSSWGKPYSPPTHVPVDPDVNTKIQVIEQIKDMDAEAFFSRFANLMKYNPPADYDTDMIETLISLGISVEGVFDFNALKGWQKRALNRAMGAFSILEIGVKKLETKDGWVVMPGNMANYGTDYLTRAGIALIGLGAIWPADVSYPVAFNDREEKELDGANNYMLHFEKDQLPPAKVTWSVSSYDPDGFYVENDINRYHLAAWMPLKYNDDGSLDIYLQSEKPEGIKEANWLPVPSKGSFNIVTRIFWPQDNYLSGSWSMPGIKLNN